MPTKSTKTNNLQSELKVFRQRRKEFLAKHAGAQVLIKGTKVIGFFDTVDQAFEEGVSRFGLEPFLIKEVQATDRLVHLVFTSRITPDEASGL